MRVLGIELSQGVDLVEVRGAAGLDVSGAARDEVARQGHDLAHVGQLGVGAGEDLREDGDEDDGGGEDDEGDADSLYQARVRPPVGWCGRHFGCDVSRGNRRGSRRKKERRGGDVAGVDGSESVESLKDEWN